jgi:hypothetical protein
MMEKQIIQKIVNALSSIDEATVIPYNDFTEERQQNMVVVRH